MNDNLNQMISNLDTYLVNPALLIIFAAGFFLFTWGLFQLMVAMSTGAEEDIKTGKNHMIWGIVGMVIMVSVYGIISLLDSTFALNISNQNPTFQNVPSSNQMFH